MHVGFVKYLFVYHVATGGGCAGDGGQKPLGGCGRLAFHGWSARNGAGLEPSLFHHAEIACCMVCPPTVIWFHIPVVGRGRHGPSGSHELPELLVAQCPVGGLAHGYLAVAVLLNVL